MPELAMMAVPLLVGLIWLVPIVYAFVLGTRLVNAVERIAVSVERNVGPKA